VDSENDFLNSKINESWFEDRYDVVDDAIDQSQKQVNSSSKDDALSQDPSVNVVSDVLTAGLRVRVYTRPNSHGMTYDEHGGNLLAIQRVDPDLFQVEDLTMFAFMSALRHARDVLSGVPNAHENKDFKTVPVRAWFRHVVVAGRVRDPQAFKEQTAFLNQIKNDTLRTRTGRVLLLGENKT